MKKYLYFAYIFLIFDQLSKFLALALFKTPVDIIDRYIFFTFQTNKNIAFSLPFPFAWIIPAQVLIIIAGCILAYFYFDWNNKYKGISFSLILSGACGNLIDRVFHGAVIDFLKIWFWPTFNLADAFITIGVIGIILGSMKKKNS